MTAIIRLPLGEQSQERQNISINQLAETVDLAGGLRERLTANRTYYVRSDGVDTNIGLANTAAGAFLTIQKAVDTACSLDLGIYAVTIQVAAGTYTTPVILKTYVGVGPINILGDTTTPANVLISVTSADAFHAVNVVGFWTIKGFKVVTVTTGINLYVNNSSVEMANCDFGASGSGLHIFLESRAYLFVSGNYSISAGASGQHFTIRSGSLCDYRVRTVTLTGTPAFGIFIYADLSSVAFIATNTFVGSATGKRYQGDTLAMIFNGFNGPNYFPGNAAGTVANGAQYV